ncbi:MAG: phage tail protein [Nitrospira sp.]
MTPSDLNSSSRPELLSHLPAAFSEPHGEGQLFRDFLAAFDDILFADKGLRSAIQSLGGYLDPQTAPSEFLPWLASWMGVTLYHRLPTPRQRQFIANAADYYRYRGTPQNLRRLLELFTGAAVEIEEPTFKVFQVGVQSAIGCETYIGGGPPHVFRVSLKLTANAVDDMGDIGMQEDDLVRVAREVIDLEKPAHTTYELTIVSDSEMARNVSPESTSTSSVTKHVTRSRKRKEDRDEQGI